MAVRQQWSARPGLAMVEQATLAERVHYCPEPPSTGPRCGQRDTFLPTIRQELPGPERWATTPWCTNLPFIVWQVTGSPDRLHRQLSAAAAAEGIGRHADPHGMIAVSPAIIPTLARRNMGLSSSVQQPGGGASPGATSSAIRSGMRLGVIIMDIVGTFAKDDRIPVWDPYNEPTNRGIFRGPGLSEEFDPGHGFPQPPSDGAGFTWAREAIPASRSPSVPGMPPTTSARMVSICPSHRHPGHGTVRRDQFPCLSPLAPWAIVAAYDRPLLCTE